VHTSIKVKDARVPTHPRQQVTPGNPAMTSENG
jgi:hypothetical protein